MTQKQRTLKVYRESGKYLLTAEEKQQLRLDIPVRINRHKQIEGEISALKNKIKDLQTTADSINLENAKAAKLVEDGFETRVQECYRLKNWEKREWQYFAMDQRMIHSHRFSDDDTQYSVFSAGDLQEIPEADNHRYTSSMYWEGKWYAFGEPIAQPETTPDPEQPQVHGLPEPAKLLNASSISADQFEEAEIVPDDPTPSDLIDWSDCNNIVLKSCGLKIHEVHAIFYDDPEAKLSKADKAARMQERKRTRLHHPELTNEDIAAAIEAVQNDLPF